MINIGFTGTNGKTSAVYFLQQLCSSANVECSSVSSLGKNFDGNAVSNFSSLIPDLKHNPKIVISEIHATLIDLGFYDDFVYDITGITNIQEFEHGEHFNNFSSYSKTKIDFLSQNRNAHLIIPKEIYSCFKLNNCQTVYDFSKDPDSNMSYSYIPNDSQNCKVQIRFKGLINTFIIPSKVFTPSLCIAYGSAVLANIVTEGDATIILDLPQGRYTHLTIQGKNILVDYAHNPSGIEAVLNDVKTNHQTGNIVCITGCGGDRDLSKRAQVGTILEKYVDTIILTSDNNRSESFEEIAAQISCNSSITKISCRREAFQHALDISKKNDLITFLGMGYEDLQLINSIIN